MPFEIGERVVFRSLTWEVEDNASESHLVLFGRSQANAGRRVRVVLGLGEPVARAQVPSLTWTIGSPKWDHAEWSALHDAYRLTLAQGRGNLGSVDWGRLILEPYQLVPLQRLESLPFPRLLLADDTGLGKTAEAGLILSRLMQRRRAERVLVLTRARPEPERWREELAAKFGLHFAVISGGADYARLRREVPAHLNVFGHVPRVIMSMHFASQRHVVDELRREVRWDVVIVDEAHHLAERGSSQKLLSELGRVVAERSEALLLLSATPHDGKGESFASLIRLLDPYAVVDPDRLDLAIVRPLVVRRLKPQVTRADGSRFLRREIHVLDVEPFRSRAEKDLERRLNTYARLLRAQAVALEQAGERQRAMGASFLETFLRKRLSSSAFACGQSLRNRLARLQGVPDAAAEDDLSEDRAQPEVAVEPFILPDGRSESEVLTELVAASGRVQVGDEAKVKALMALLDKQLAGQKVIVFTEYLDTLTMLTQVLDAAGWSGSYVTYHGGTTAADRQAIQERFQNDPAIRLFLGTDAASEGINLQKRCSSLVHMEIPWNPNRFEQRNGRIDRYGQTQRPQVYLLVAQKSLEQRVAQVVLQKLETIAQDVGSVTNVFPLAAAVRVDDFLDSVDADAAAAEATRRLDATEAKVRAELAEQVPDELVRGDPMEVHEMRKILAELQAARAVLPQMQDVERFLRQYLKAEIGGAMTPAGTDGVYRIVVPKVLVPEVGADVIPLATFRRDLALREEDSPTDGVVAFLSPGHPLVAAALRRMRGRVYQPGFQSRISYRKEPSGHAPGFLFTFALRFVDGRGETIDERFEPVWVGLDHTVSRDAEADLNRFALPAAARDPNLTALEEQRLLQYKEALPLAMESAMAEAQRRQTRRVEELIEAQDAIAEDALIRLGKWKQASEARVARRFEDVAMGKQLELFGPTERRLQQFRKEQELLLRQEQERRAEIRTIKKVRGEGLDLIGALVLVPETAMP